MFDFGKLLSWISGGLFEPEKTWETYKADGHQWKTTAGQFSLPLIVASGVLSLILGWLFSGSYVLGGSGGFAGFIYGLIMGLVWFGLGGWIASFLASKFGGTDSFDNAWSALTFASIPGMVGSVLGTLPWFGWLLALGGFIWSLVLLFQALPKFLDVPEERSVGHFFATLGLSFVAMLVTGTILGTLGLGMASTSGDGSFGDDSWADIQREIDDARDDRSSRPSVDASNPRNSGSRDATDNNDGSMFGFGREVDYLEQANEDRYAPPSDGKLSEKQVDTTVRYLAAAQRLRDASQDNLEKLGSENSEPSLSDIFKGVKGMLSASTAEMQSVKSGGGNWAEHEWVKKQLFEARLHQDLNDTTAHNFELYQQYEEQLKDWL